MSDSPNVDALLDRVARLTQRITALTTASDVATTSAVDLLNEVRATPTPDRGAARRVVWSERTRGGPRTPIDTDGRATLWPVPAPQSPVFGGRDDDRRLGGSAGASGGAGSHRAAVAASPPRRPPAALRQLARTRVNSDGTEADTTVGGRDDDPPTPVWEWMARRVPATTLAPRHVNPAADAATSDALAFFDMASERAAAEEYARSARAERSAQSPLARALAAPRMPTPLSPRSPGPRGTPLSPRSATARAVLESLSPPSVERRRSGSADAGAASPHSVTAAASAVLSPHSVTASPRAHVAAHVRSLSPLHEWSARAEAPAASSPTPSSPSREPASTPGSLSASPPGHRWSPGAGSDAAWSPPRGQGVTAASSLPRPHQPDSSPGAATWSPGSRAGSFSASADDEASAGDDEPSPVASPVGRALPACEPARELPACEPALELPAREATTHLSLECDEDGGLMDAPLTLSVAPPPPAMAPPPVYLSPRRTTDEGAELMDSDDYADPTPPASPKLAPAVVSLTASAASPAVRSGGRTLTPASAQSYALAVLTASAGGLPRPPPPPGTSPDAADAVADAAAEALALEADTPRAASGAPAGAPLREAAAVRVAGWVAHVDTHGDGTIAAALAQDAHDDAVAWRLREAA